MQIVPPQSSALTTEETHGQHRNWYHSHLAATKLGLDDRGDSRSPVGRCGAGTSPLRSSALMTEETRPNP